MKNALLKFRQPAQYIGNEFFSVKKDWSLVAKRFLIASPATYEMSASSLGLKILYHVINSKKDCLCERVFMPGDDVKEYLLKNGAPLVSLETKHLPRDFSIVGITFTSRSSMLLTAEFFELLKIPLLNRDDSFPVVVAGGPAVSNFVPLVDFFDAFIVGDGEEVLGDMLDEYASSRKDAFLERVSKIKGVYVPGKSECVKKAVCRLPAEYYPVKPIIPNIRTLQNRLDIEVMRGCPNNCRFCEAKRFYSPVRVRPKEELKEIIFSSVRNTGYGSISLTSLSTPQYPHIMELVEEIIPFLSGHGISLQIPSLRPDRKSFDCVMKILKLNQVNLTFAPETFSPRLQRVLGKITPFDEFERMLFDIRHAGFRDVKIYLMAGLPTETDEDIASTIKALNKLKKTGLKIAVTVSVFVPAPHTPFQWVKFREPAEICERVRRMKKEMNGIAVRAADLDGFLVEGILSRADEKVKPVLAAMKGLAGFSFDFWKKEMGKIGIDAVDYIRRDFMRGELPWGKIEIADGDELRKEYETSLGKNGVSSIFS
ncbi:MAG: radical SAM protein [bacterium]